MAWADDIAAVAADIFDLAGETVWYTPTAYPFTVEVSAVFRPLNPDDVIGPHIMADDVVCQVQASALQDDPERGDIVERNPDAVWPDRFEVVERMLLPGGVWQLVCRKNIRVTP